MNDDAIYQQTGMILIDQNNANQTNNQVRIDPKTGEVTLDAFQPIDNIQLCARISLRKDEQIVRCIDVFKNIGPADAAVNVQYVTTLNRGVTAAQDDFRSEKDRLGSGLGRADGSRQNRGRYFRRQRRRPPANCNGSRGATSCSTTFRSTCRPAKVSR